MLVVDVAEGDIVVEAVVVEVDGVAVAVSLFELDVIVIVAVRLVVGCEV